MAEPIGVKPGVYTVSGEPVMGLCIVIDDAEAGWKVTDGKDDSITISIPSDSPWRVMRVPDEDDPNSFYLQVFRKDGKLNSVVLQSFVHPTGEVHTPNADHPEGQPPELKIFYTNPEEAVAAL